LTKEIKKEEKGADIKQRKVGQNIACQRRGNMENELVGLKSDGVWSDPKPSAQQKAPVSEKRLNSSS
jgi:hypothetical protein